EIARVWRVCRDVILRSRIEILLAARHRRGYALILLAQLPPRVVVIVWPNLARKDFPAPLVHEIAKRQKCDLVQRSIQQKTDIRALVRNLVDQPELLQVRGRNGKRNSVADGFVKTIVGAVAKQKRLARVGHLVIVVAQLVMDDR